MIACIVTLMFSAALPGSDAYLLGKSHEEAGRYAAATEAYAQCITADPALAPYARVRAAACRVRGGDTAGGLEAYRAVIAEQPAGPWTRMARAELGFLLLQQRDSVTAEPLLNDALSVEPAPWWMDKQRMRAADGLLESPATLPQAAAYYRGALDRLKTWASRRDVALKLARSPMTDDKMRAALVLAESAAYDDAKRLMIELASQAPASGPEAIQWRYMQGRVYLGTGQTAEGRQALEEVFAAAPDSEWGPKALAWIARTFASSALNAHGAVAERAELASQAEDAFQRLVGRYPDAEATGDALWWWARALAEQDKTEAAVSQFVRLADTCPTHDRVDDAFMTAAQLLREAKEVARAAALCKRLLELHPSTPFASEAWYLRGEQGVARNEREDAARCFQEAARGPLGDFYAHRAAARIKRSESNPGKGVSGVLPSGGDFLRTLPNRVTSRPAALTPIPDDPRVQRLVFFGRSGFDEAEWEALGLAEALQRGGEAGLDAATVCRVMAESGLVVSAGRLAAVAGLPVNAETPTPESLRADFPLAYWREAMSAAHDAGVNPLLLLAVARQESTFRPKIVSSAGATGVMQLLPSTARWLVTTRSEIGADVPEKLEYPAASLRLGAFYLRQMRDRFDGNTILAVAAYNGGPGNVNKWRKSHPTNDMDRFIESIPFSETQTYVKRVLGNYAAYCSLYTLPAD